MKAILIMKNLVAIFILFFAYSPCLEAAQMFFTPKLTVGGEFNDNIFLSEDDEEHDFLTTIAPGFSFNLQGQKSGLQLSYDPSYVIYDRFSEYDNWRHSANLEIYGNFSSKLRLDLTDSFLYSEDPVNEDDFTLRQIREPYAVNNSEMRLTYSYSSEESIAIGARHYFRENDDPSTQDSAYIEPFLEIIHWFNFNWGSEFESSYQQAEFDSIEETDASDNFDRYMARLRLINRSSVKFNWFVQYQYNDFKFDVDSEDYRVHEPSIGLNYSPSQTLSTSLLIGYLVREQEQGNDDDRLNITASLIKTYQKGEFNFFINSGFDQVSFGSEDLGYSTYYEGGIGIDHNFTERISGNIQASYREADYKEQTGDRKDDIRTAGCGLSIRLLRWLFFRVNYSYRELDSTDDSKDYTENRYFGTLTAQPSMPIRF